MKNLIPTKSAVKKHFKGVKKVKSFGIYAEGTHNIKPSTIVFDEISQSYYCDTDNPNSDCCLWREEFEYAKIIERNQPKTK